MVRIRLRRTGKKKQPSYRIVVADSRAPRDGKFIEIIGHYNPVQQPKVLEVKADRARYWLSVGAQPSDTTARLLRQVNVLDENGKATPDTGETLVSPAATAAPAASAPATPAPAASPAPEEAVTPEIAAAPEAPIEAAPEAPVEAAPEAPAEEAAPEADEVRES